MRRTRLVHDLLRAGSKGVVNLTAQLISHDDEDHERRCENRKRNGRRGNDRQSCTEAHGSRSA